MESQWKDVLKNHQHQPNQQNRTTIKVFLLISFGYIFSKVQCCPVTKKKKITWEKKNNNKKGNLLRKCMCYKEADAVAKLFLFYEVLIHKMMKYCHQRQVSNTDRLFFNILVTERLRTLFFLHLFSVLIKMSMVHSWMLTKV